MQKISAAFVLRGAELLPTRRLLLDPGGLPYLGRQTNHLGEPVLRIATIKDGRTRYQDVRAGLNQFLDVFEADAAFHLNGEVQPTTGANLRA